MTFSLSVENAKRNKLPNKVSSEKKFIFFSPMLRVSSRGVSFTYLVLSASCDRSDLKRSPFRDACTQADNSYLSRYQKRSTRSKYHKYVSLKRERKYSLIFAKNPR